jgi:uncharacterized membrane protein
MTPFQYGKLYAATLLAFLVIDMIWLGLVARGFYRDQLGYLLSPRPNWTAAVVFYLIFIAGLLTFVIVPGLQAGSLRKVLVLGAFFGFVTYATYDLTNLATIKDWPWKVTLVDMCWGSFLAAATSYAGFATGRWLGAN